MPESMVKLLQSLVYGVAIVAASWVYTTQGPQSNGPPTVGPVAAETFAQRVAASFGGDSTEAAYLIACYQAKQAVLASKVEIADTAELFDIYALAFRLACGDDNKRIINHQRLTNTIVAEAVNRGLLAPDDDGDGYQDEPLPVDRDGWSALFGTVIEGLK